MSQKTFVKTALRLPADLHASLHAAAKEGERSYNAEILHRLRRTFKAVGTMRGVKSDGGENAASQSGQPSAKEVGI